MPRLKPPPSQVRQEEPPVLEDHELPTEPVEIELAGDDAGPTEVELAPPPKPKPEKTEDDNPLQRALDAQKAAEELQRTALRERDEALRQAQQRDSELTRERTGREDAEYNAILTAIAAEQSALDKAEADFAGYSSVGDWQAAAKAQRIMTTTSARLDRLEDGKQTFDQRREAAKTETPPERTQQQPLDFEQQIAKMPESAKNWLRKHPEFINDTQLNQKIGNAHNYLVSNRGIEPFSEKYFDALDSEFGFKTEPEVQQQQPQRRSMPLSAPVSRDVPTANGQRQNNSVTLTAEERAIARSSFTAPDMTNAQKELLYAQNKKKLQMRRANGEYPMPERN